MWNKICNEDIEKIEKLKQEYDLEETYDLGRFIEGKITNIDKEVVYELKSVLACIIRDYLRLYNKVNLNAEYPTVYKKAIYEDIETKKQTDDFFDQTGTPEELDKWADIIEETAKKFDLFSGDWECNSQAQVDKAFDSLKKIFLGLWT